MFKALRKHATTIVIAMATAAVTAGGPALAAAVQDGLNADQVDNKHAVGSGATAGQRAGKLVATNSSGKLPNSIISKAPDANKLDGVDSTGFLRKSAKAANADKLDDLDSSAFSRPGTIELTASAEGWLPFQSSDPLSYTRYNPYFSVSRSSAGGSLFKMPFTLPTTLNDTPMSMSAIRFCNQATAAVPVDYLQVMVMRNDVTTGNAFSARTVADNTSRTGGGCTTLSVTPAANLLPGDYLAILVQATWSPGGVGQSIALSGVTVTLEPSDAASLSAQSPSRQGASAPPGSPSG